MITLTDYFNENRNWEFVKEKIVTSTIYRFDYKRILGESLTAFITNRRDLPNENIINEILSLETTQYMLKVNPHLRKKFIENLQTSISSRKAEQNSFEKRNSLTDLS